MAVTEPDGARGTPGRAEPDPTPPDVERAARIAVRSDVDQAGVPTDVDQPSGSSAAGPRRALKDPVLWVPIVLVGLLAGWYAVGPDGFSGQMRLGMLVSALLNLGGMVCSIATVRLLRGRPAARFWYAMVVGGALFALADLLQLVGAPGDPVAAVVARGGGAAPLTQGVAAAVFVVVILTYPLGFGSRREALRFWLDMGTVLVAVGAFAVYTSDGLTERGHVASYEAMLGPVVQLVAVFALAKLILCGTTLFPPATAVTGLGCAMLGGVAGLVAPSLGGTGQEHWAFLLLPLSSGCFLAAARFGQIGLRHDPRVLSRTRNRSYSRLPYIAIATVYGLLLSTLPDQGLGFRVWVVVVAAAVSTGLVVIRQITSFEENNRLLEELRRALVERDVLQAELQRKAFFDDLTGIANRALFMDRLEAACRRTEGDGSSLAVMLIDLDDFKPVNDTYGHAAGDALLAEVAVRMVGTLRRSDTVARLGGDEFAVILHHPMPDQVDAVIDRLNLAISRPYRIGTVEVAVNASIGVAVDAHGKCAPDILLARADDAMYRAKAHRKDGGGVPAADAPAVRNRRATVTRK